MSRILHYVALIYYGYKEHLATREILLYRTVPQTVSNCDYNYAKKLIGKGRKHFKMLTMIAL